MPVPVARWFALALSAAAAACGSGESGPPVATLGTGEASFEPLADGDTIFVIQGPQGGFHVLGSVRVSGIEPGDPDDLQAPDNPTTTFRVFAGAERVDAQASSYTQGLDASPDGDTFEMIGRLVILDILADDELDGVDLRIEVEVEGADGSTASDARELRGAPHPFNP